MKKKTIVISCIGAAILLAGGVAFGINRYQYSKNVVDVVPVELLNSDWGMDEEGNSGTVTNSMSQEVTPSDDQTVKKIYVKEGQTVKIGDKLVAYDMAEKKLDLELKGYDVKQIEFSITRAEKELSNLKKGIVSDSSSGSNQSVGRKNPLLASIFLRSSEAVTASESGSSSISTAAETTTNASSEGAEEKTTATQAPTTEEEKPTTTEKPASTTEAPDEPAADATVYSTLTSSSVPYRGDGSAESPYRFLCTSDCKIKGSFINMIRGYNASGSEKTGSSKVVILEVRKGNTTSGAIINSWTINGANESKKNKNSTWNTIDDYVSGSSAGSTSTTEDTEDPSTSDGDDDPYEPIDPGSGYDSDGGDTGISYTKDEINTMIKEKEAEITDLKLDLKEAKLEYDTLEKEIKDGTVTAVINGIVKEVKNPDDAAAEGGAVVTVASEGNLYVKGVVDEFSYNSLKAGNTITASSWETGTSFEAKVTEVSSYPVSSGSSYSYGGSGNPNVSYYPFTAIIEDQEQEVSNGESVTISFDKNKQIQSEGSLYIPLAYVRTENNKSYVYLQGKDKKLEKRYVTTGQTLYNYVIEIKSGLQTSDYIAFPYGKTIKEGAKTKVSEDESDILY